MEGGGALDELDVLLSPRKTAWMRGVECENERVVQRTRAIAERVQVLVRVARRCGVVTGEEMWKREKPERWHGRSITGLPCQITVTARTQRGYSEDTFPRKRVTRVPAELQRPLLNRETHRASPSSSPSSSSPLSLLLICLSPLQCL